MLKKSPLQVFKEGHSKDASLYGIKSLTNLFLHYDINGKLSKTRKAEKKGVVHGGPTKTFSLVKTHCSKKLLKSVETTYVSTRNVNDGPKSRRGQKALPRVKKLLSCHLI